MVAAKMHGLASRLFWWFLLLGGWSVAGHAQAPFTFNFPDYSSYWNASSTPDGGFVVSQGGLPPFFYSKFDSSAVFQYGWQVQGPGQAATQFTQRFGKIFALMRTHDFYVEIAKVDMATGVMQSHKRITGPTGTINYFTAGPRQMIATQDSGLILVLTEQQCSQIANCSICHLKLDKNLNFQFFNAGTFLGVSTLPTQYAAENADGTFTHAHPLWSPALGYATFLARYASTGGLMGHTVVRSGGAFGASPLNISSHGNEITVTGDHTGNCWVMSLPVNLSSVNWWKQYVGPSAVSLQTFTMGPGNTLYGLLGNRIMALDATGQVKWAMQADGNALIVPSVRVGSTRMLGMYTVPGFQLRAALIDSAGAGLCTPVNNLPTVTSLAPLTTTVSFTSYLTVPVTVTSLAVWPSIPYQPSFTTQCSALCNFTAAFSVSTNLLTASFTSQPPGISAHAWTFGDGGSSTQAHPSHTYAASGTYTVCYIATSGCMSDTVCQQVTVSCQPATAGFSTTINPNTVTFTNASIGSGSLTYAWDFGDGGTSTAASPTHVYAGPGYYAACLIANGPCGSDTSCQLLNVGCGTTTAGFTQTDSLLSAQFTNTSIGQGNAAYSWDFGDGSASTAASPSHTYALAGNYTVCLVVTTPCGGDSICQTVEIFCNPPVAAFLQSDTLLTAQFTNTGTSQASATYHWDFGDGNTSTAANPSHTYAASGTYTVCLVVTSICGSDTTCQPVEIICDAPTVAFAYSAQLRDVQFTGTVTGPGPLTYSWTFGDGVTSSLANPFHTYAQPGVYWVCLVATGYCGPDTLCDSVHVVCPPLTAAIGSAGNFPVIQFTDLSIGSPYAWAWDYGDGNTSTLQNPTHAYPSPGTYQVCLTVTDSCRQDSSCIALDVLVGVATPAVEAWEVFPSPADHALHIQFPRPLAFQAAIFRPDGVRVLSAEFTGEGSLEVSSWPAGIYWLKLETPDQIVFKQFMVAH
jgi:PKD repeat protein